MKVLIVSPCVNLPVPAVHGGAVSTLIEYLMKENEIEKKMQLTVLSIYDSKAEKVARKYTNTQVEYVHPRRCLDLCDHLVDDLLMPVCGKHKKHQYFRKQYVLSWITQYLKNNNFDKVIFQNSGYLLNVLKNKTITDKYKGKLYYHLHNDIPDNISVSAVRQCKMLLISEYLKKHINEVCKQDMSEQCTIVKNGFDCNRFARVLSMEEKKLLRQKLGIELDKKIILFTGRITKEKGIAELVQAIEKIKRTDVVMVVVGAHNFGTGQTSEFQKEMEQQFLKLEKKVYFTGYVPYDEIWKYYQFADIAVLPSIWEEPAGLTMIEACAAGVPLITTKSGGIPEYVDGKYSILLDRDYNLANKLTESISSILDNYAVWKKKAAIAQKRVCENYDTVNYYNDFYTAMIKR